MRLRRGFFHANFCELFENIYSVDRIHFVWSKSGTRSRDPRITVTLGFPRNPQEIFQPPELLKTLRTPWYPKILPGTIGILRDVMHEKHVSRIIIRFSYLRRNKFSVTTISTFLNSKLPVPGQQLISNVEVSVMER